MATEKTTAVAQYERIKLFIEFETNGSTLGKTARAMGLSKTRTLYYLRLLVEHGYIYRCRVKNGHQKQFEPILYFSAARMGAMLNEAPEVGHEYQIKQRTIFEVLRVEVQ